MILDSWARRILEFFADAYPTSAHYRGGRRLRLGAWEKRFPEITTDVDGKDGFLAAVEELARRGVLVVRWRRFRTGEEVEALLLDDPPTMYELLQRESPWDHRDALLATLKTPPWDDTRLRELADHARTRLVAHHPLAVESVEDLRDIGRLLLLTPQECTGLAVRAVSVRLYRDSKRLEALLPRADVFMTDAEGEKVSRRLGLARSYPEVLFALYGSIQWADVAKPTGEGARETREWTVAGEMVSLPGETVRAIDSVSLTELTKPSAPTGIGTPWVLTVENKESFYVAVAAMRDAWRATPVKQANPPSAVTCTHGHPGATVCTLVALAGKTGAPIVHFGDLDPEGLLIAQELAAGTGHGVRPFLMNLETYHRYRSYGRNLSEHSLARLEEITHPDLIALAEEIRRYRVGVEQEVIPLSF